VFIFEVEWNDGTVATIYRRYSELFAFQVALLNKFPVEAGIKGNRRVIPFLPGQGGGADI
jgi:hypothetical protein